jgi:chromosomal replication initiator protein
MTPVTALGEPRARGGAPVARPEILARSAGATLATTVTGPWNRLAHEASRRFVESRGAWSRVLLIAGGEGNGKTHLLASIEAGLRDGGGRRPAVVRVTCDDFMRAFTFASTQGRMAAFRQKYRTTEILLLDDVDRLTGRPATQEEFLHLFDHLDSAGRSIVVTTRAKPRDIEGLRKPLQSRLAAAMQVRLEPPDETGRRSLLQLAALRDRRTLPPEVLAAAASATGNVRDVLDRWSRLRETASISVSEAYAASGPVKTAGPTLDVILEAVARQFGLRTAELTGNGRARRLTAPRHVCFYLAKKMTGHSLQEIAKHFGGKNHATVLYACKKVTEALPGDAELRKKIEASTARVEGRM